MLIYANSLTTPTPRAAAGSQLHGTSIIKWVSTRGGKEKWAVVACLQGNLQSGRVQSKRKSIMHYLDILSVNLVALAMQVAEF